MGVARQAAGLVLIAGCVGGCSGGHSGAVSSTIDRHADGVIVGRMYADGGPPVCVTVPTTHCGPAVVYEPVQGEITVQPVGSASITTTAHPDRRGRFRVLVGAGRYRVVGQPTGGFASVGRIVQVVVVSAGRTTSVDLGVHMP